MTLSTKDPQARWHHEENADGRVSWLCIPYVDALQAANEAVILADPSDIRKLKEKLEGASWVEDAHGEVVLLSDAEDAVDEAVDLQSYPTAWAYEQVCRLRDEQSARIAVLEQVLDEANGLLMTGAGWMAQGERPTLTNQPDDKYGAWVMAMHNWPYRYRSTRAEAEAPIDPTFTNDLVLGPNTRDGTAEWPGDKAEAQMTACGPCKRQRHDSCEGEWDGVRWACRCAVSHHD